MITTMIRITLVAVFILLIHRGEYSPPPTPSRRPGREYIEVGILAACLLITPFIKFDLFWFSGWKSAYFVLGLCAPLVMELLVRRRHLSTIGFKLPVNRKTLAFVAGIFSLYLIARLAEPLMLGKGYHFELRNFISITIIFPFLEEVYFRGLIQTRLESALGAVRSWIVSGLLFGFFHFYLLYLVPGEAPDIAEALGLVYLTALGMLLGLVFAKTRSLLPSFAIHAINNFSI